MQTDKLFDELLSFQIEKTSLLIYDVMFGVKVPSKTIVFITKGTSENGQIARWYEKLILKLIFK